MIALVPHDRRGQRSQNQPSHSMLWTAAILLWVTRFQKQLISPVQSVSHRQ